MVYVQLRIKTRFKLECPSWRIYLKLKAPVPPVAFSTQMEPLASPKQVTFSRQVEKNRIRCHYSKGLLHTHPFSSVALAR